MQTVLNTSAEESPDKATAATTHTIAGLIGYLPELQFYQLLHIDNIVETRPIEELHTLWKAATDYCARLTTSPSSTFSITPLPKTLEIPGAGASATPYLCAVLCRLSILSCPCSGTYHPTVVCKSGVCRGSETESATTI